MSKEMTQQFSLSLFLLAHTLSFGVFSQEYCFGDRFEDSPYFTTSELQIIEDIQYANAPNWQNASTNLFLDIYAPDSTVDTLEKRPLVVFIPGGGFLSASKDYFAVEAEQLALRGYVCASISYRVGWESNGAASECNGELNSLIYATYRACQDIHSAMRYLTHFADSFRIDTSNMFLVASSAGSISGMMNQFMTSSEIDNEYLGVNLIDSLGGIDTVGNNFNEEWSSKGFVSFWGGIANTDYINLQNSVPMLLVHGVLDSIIFYNEGSLYDCSNYYSLQGSGKISQKLNALEVCHELNYETTGDHGIYTQEYRIERMIHFFNRILCDDCRTLVFEDQLQIEQLNESHLANIHNKEAMNLTFEIFPNPTSGLVNLRSSVDSAFDFIVHDLNGRQVFSSNFNEMTTVDLSAMKAGVYLVTIKSEDENVMQTQKLVIQN